MQRDVGVGTLERGLVHVAKQADDGDLPDGSAEEKFLDGLRGDGSERGEEK